MGGTPWPPSSAASAPAGPAIRPGLMAGQPKVASSAAASRRSAGPWRAPFEDPGIDRAAGDMRAGQIPDAHQELAYDLAPGKAEGLLEQLHPFLLGARMVCCQPAGE